jgi:hypothetical protein
MTIVIHAHEDLECCSLLDTWEGISNGPSAESKTSFDLRIIRNNSDFGVVMWVGSTAE